MDNSLASFLASFFLLADFFNVHLAEEKFVCVKPFKKSLDDEIDLELGAIVDVIQKGSDGWWEVRYVFYNCIEIFRCI